MRNREEKGKVKGKGGGKKESENPSPPFLAVLPVIPFGSFFLPLFIPVPVRAEQKKE